METAPHTPCPGSGTPSLHLRAGALWCEDAPVSELASRFGTPLYVYSAATMTQRYRAVRTAFGPDAHVCYAVKANSNLSILRHFAALGAGFDLVSGGELQRLLAAGVPTGGAVFAGVAKQPWEIDAALNAGILLFQVESPHEVGLLEAAGARRGVRVPVAVRLNPDVDPGTHAYISTGRKDSKFGTDLSLAGELVDRILASPSLALQGYHVHLGSQLRTIEPYLQAFERVAAFMAASPARRAGVRYYNLGGGFGIGYGKGEPLDVAALAATLLPRIRALGLVPVVEPGRYLVGDAGVLVTSVLGEKLGGSTRYLLVDAAMNDLLRPSLYQAEHPLVPVHTRGRPSTRFDVVGPVCESGDFLARGRELEHLEPGELLAVLGAGAYGSSMASHYNSRRRPAEVLVSGATVQLIRRREPMERLWADEVDL